MPRKNTIEVTKIYRLKWKIKGMPTWAISSCGKVFNVQRRRMLKKSFKDMSPGYWLGKKFLSMKNIESLKEKI